MRIDVVLRYVGTVLLLVAFFMLVSAMISLFNNVDAAFFPLLISFIITTILGSFSLIFVPAAGKLSAKEGYIIVIASWVMCCIVGTLPYLIWGGEFTICNALFESTSGFTTTGATILNDVEALPKGLLFWRSSTLWVGGVGVILFALIILPSAGHAKLTLSSVEMSTVAKENFAYNTRQMVRVVIMVYLALTLAQTLLLWFVGMDLFDSVCHSFSTIATGGFSTKNAGIMFYNSIWIEIVLMLFMVIGGIHFGLLYSTFKGGKSNIFNSEVTRFYFLMLLIGGVAVTINLYASGLYNTLGESLRHGVFQVISYNTTSGYATTDNSAWPPFAMLILIYMSIQCATAGSTTGGVKADRIMLLGKAIRARVIQLQHPNVIRKIKLNGKLQDATNVSAAILLILFFILSIFISTVFLSLWGIGLGDSFSTSIAAISNVGSGFIANLENMNPLPNVVKLWLSIIMLFGRLELFGLIHLFLIRSWR